MTVEVVWVTPDAEKHLAYIARVSNPDNQENPNYAKLLKYMLDNGHWSPFEMVNLCIEINTTRDIARQILRHRSFSYQEFSQRYQTVDKLGDMVYRECRLQDTKNRQNSLPCEDEKLAAGWEAVQYLAFQRAKGEYEGAVAAGIAKEVARALLPEGLTPSRMYVNGTLRSWIHYVEVRCDESTQKEHREIANAVKGKLVELFPTVASAMGWGRMSRIVQTLESEDFAKEMIVLSKKYPLASTMLEQYQPLDPQQKECQESIIKDKVTHSSYHLWNESND